MKVALINLCDNGSTGKICIDIMNNQEDSKLFIGQKSHLDSKNIYKISNKSLYRLNQIKSIIFDKDELVAQFTTKKLIKLINEFNPDIIHLHNLHGYYINYKILFDYIKRKNIKVIWTLHDCWAFTGHCAYFDIVKCEKWKTGCFKCANLKQYPKSLFFDRSKPLYNFKKDTFNGVKDMTIVCPSNWLANLVKQSFLKNYPVHVINNGINMENFKQIDNHTFDNIIDRNKKILLGVASPFSERKGYSDFIKLSKIIDKTKYQIVMVGVNVKQIKKLQEYEIIGIERTENQIQLAELYSLAYCFLNTTYEDNFPTVNIEALACGCPVITYKTGGSVEVITKENGYIVEQGNIDELYRTINILKNSNIDREKISIEATKLYDKSIMCEKDMKLYKEKL